MANSIFTRYSFSGSDVSNVCWYSLLRDGGLVNSAPCQLDTITTVSISVHETKVPARSLGFKSVKGHTGSLRTIGGTIITSIMNDHPIKPLMDEYLKLNAASRIGPWSYSLDHARDGSGFIAGLNLSERRNIMPTVLPPFNMLFNAMSELASMTISSPEGVEKSALAGQTIVPFAQVMLFGVEFIDDGLVMSTNNPLTEQTFTFVAQDYAVLEEKQTGLGPRTSTDLANRSDILPIYSDLDRQKIWMQSIGLKNKPGEVMLNYDYDENGDIVGITSSSVPTSIDNVEEFEQDKIWGPWR